MHLLLEYTDLEEEEILIPKGRATYFSQDYFHRKYTIDTQIAIHQEAKKQGMEVSFFVRYFDKVGSARKGGLTSLAKINIDSKNFIIPDGIFMIDRGGEQYLYCLEIYNGKDTKRVVNQLKKHIRALEL